MTGGRLLPVRESRALPPDLSRHARTLVEQFRLDDGVHQLRVRAASPLVGLGRSGLDFAGRELTIVTVHAAGSEGEVRLGQIGAGDLLLVRGEPEAVAALAIDFDLALRDEADVGPIEQTLFNRESGLAEVLVPPRSPLIGDRLFPGMVTPSGDLVVLAVQRQGADLSRGQPLAVGDTLLLQGTWGALDRHLAPPEVLVVNSPDLVRRQAVPMGPGAVPTLAVLAAMVVLLATGVVPAAIAGLLAAGAVLLLGVLSVDEIYRAINWTTVILVGAMMPLSTAITETGAAKLLADGLIGGGRRRRAAGAARRALRADGGARAGDLEHCDRVDYHTDFGGGGRRDGGVAAAGADGGRGGRGGGVPDAGGDADQPDGDGAGRLSLRRLLEVRAADDALVLRRRGRAGAGDLAVLRGGCRSGIRGAQGLTRDLLDAHIHAQRMHRACACAVAQARRVNAVGAF